ncbi:TIGR02206 family membrane protein [Fictibacillus iocasae]|uniref:TIGR02206 family membrane protein n=1 Tax=Fictibacillus iocasae TaxID=2715437 RepID=A0ABW2NTP9_9BACL
MDSFFGVKYEPFYLFSTSHLIAMAVVLVIILSLIPLRMKLTGSVDKVFRYTLALLLILCEVSYHGWALYNGDWRIAQHLPLQLCSLSILTSSILLLTNNMKLFPFVYFAGFVGASQAMITPELEAAFPHYRFYDYFVAHGAIMIAAMYYVIVKRVRIRLVSLFKTFAFINVYALFVYIVNVMTGANYMFLMRKPENGNIMDFLGPHPWYILSLEAVAFVLCLMAYYPIRRSESLVPFQHSSKL